MDMPQQNANENRYFSLDEGTPGVAIRLRGVSDLIRFSSEYARATELHRVPEYQWGYAAMCGIFWLDRCFPTH